ncbi:cell division protein FtsK [Mycobacterium sp. 21AC1]|uniref:cell division protein FtsK n=1 Tax=[Mycobacterium] appelbergii TaxID=2939269 RepID=UPI0029393BCE|nr:cell division protein FtsK [Mycobacterium sp. 21AC1]MDV3125617.1 cell division protein FtsK [Mycobacterium sp. 21AC1]
MGIAWWIASLTGFGNLLFWLACAAVLGAAIVAAMRFRRHRRFAMFGAELYFASSIVQQRDKWADLMEILDLCVDADLRRTRSARARGVVSGVAWSDRRSVRYTPTVVGVSEAPYGLAVTVDGAPGQSRDGWERHCGQLSSALRVPEVAVAEPSPGTFELQLRVRDPLGTPNELSSVPRSRDWELPLGVDEQGRSIARSCRNLSGVVVGGIPGSGASNWLTLALASLAQRDDIQWLLIDGKQGYDLEVLAWRAYRYISGDAAGELETVRDALQDVQMLMLERLRKARALYGHADLWSAGPSRLHPVVVVVIDECQWYLDARSFPSKESKAVGAEIDAIVRDLVKRGRSAGILVILSTQRPTADSIPTSTRDNCALRVCFSVRTRESAVAVLGEFSTDSAASLIGAPTDVGVSSLDGLEVRFRTPFVSDNAVREHIGANAGLSADPLDLLSSASMDLAIRADSTGADKPDGTAEFGHKPAGAGG